MDKKRKMERSRSGGEWKWKDPTRHLFLSSLVALGVFGCAVGPNYQRPPVETPASWRFEEKEALGVANAAWWEQFEDPVLNSLIRIALAENREVKIAAARVEEFMGRYGTTRASLLPRIGGGASAGQNRVTEKGPSPLPSSYQNPAESYQAFLNASWEIDLWGKLRRATEAARADLLSTGESRRAVILTLVTSVASAYVNLRDMDKQLEIARRTAESREDQYKLFELRFEKGVISETELVQAKSEYERALATLPFLEKMIAQQENLLSLLLGQNPGPIPRGKTIDELNLPRVPAGLPSDLLANRPDIRLAEQNLIAANARIGVARAQYFPSISLTGIYGYASSDLTNLFMGPSKTWSWAVPLTAPIFTGGAIRGQVRSAEAIQQQALLRYQQMIQSSFREVEDALIDQSKSRERLEIQTRLLDSLQNYVRLARLRFDNGYSSYLEVLDAERRLFEVELLHAETKGALFQSLVNLYKAMGGGWILEAERLTENATNPGETKQRVEVFYANQ